MTLPASGTEDRGPQPVLRCERLCVRYSGAEAPALDEVSLSLGKGEILGVMGESGCGKSTLLLSLLGLLPEGTEVRGGVELLGRDMLHMNARERREVVWREAALVFQNREGRLNPSLTVERQIGEVLRRDPECGEGGMRARLAELMAQVGLDARWLSAYPRQLSGGMRQKVLIAMALALRPGVLLVDEPTTSLEELSKYRILELLLRLKEDGVSLIVASHDVAAVRAVADRAMVLLSGRVMEEAPVPSLILRPGHPYTRGLIRSSPEVDPCADLWGMPDALEGTDESGAAGCPFYARCVQRIAACARIVPPLQEDGSPGHAIACLRGGIVPVLSGRGISKTFRLGKETVSACRDCHIEVRSGETVAVIGESGSGKTTLSRILCGMEHPESGEVLFQERPLEEGKELGRPGGIQMVFQDPFTAINADLTVAQAVSEPLCILMRRSAGLCGEQVVERVRAGLEELELPASDAFLNRRAGTLSGGQLQRVALARAMTLTPRLLIADELTAMLDPSTQTNLLRLLKERQFRRGFSMVFVTHDLAVARKIADSVYVMKDGAVVEHGPTQQVFRFPRHEWTRKLLERLAGL